MNIAMNARVVNSAHNVTGAYNPRHYKHVEEEVEWCGWANG